MVDIHDVVSRVVKNGQISIRDFESLNISEISSFISAVLNEEIGSIFSVPDITPHYIMHEIYKKLNLDYRLLVEERLVEYLSDLAQNTNSAWRGKSGDYLLLSVVYVFSNSSRKDYPIDFLYSMALNRVDLISIEPNLHWRACQSLVSLDFDGGSQFWQDLEIIGGPGYGGVIFAGLSAKDPSRAISWLKKNTTNSAAIDALLMRLPLFIDTLGGIETSKLVMQIYPFLPDERKEELLDATLELEIPLEGGVLRAFSVGELEELAEELEISISSSKYSTEDLRSYILEVLISRYYDPSMYEAPIQDMIVISSVSKFVFQNPHRLSPKFRSHFYRMGKMMLTVIQPQTKDTITFTSEISIINDDLDVTEELAKYLG